MPRTDRADIDYHYAAQILDNPDVYSTWLREGDPEIITGDIVGAIFSRFTGRAAAGNLTVSTGVYLNGANGDESDVYREALLNGYASFEEAYSNPRILGIKSFEARYTQEMTDKTKLALAKKKLTVVGGYVLYKSSEDSTLASYFEVANPLIRQAQVAASESGLIQRDHETVKSFKGRIMRLKPIDGEQYGCMLAKSALFKLLPSSAVVADKVQDQLAARTKGNNDRTRPLRRSSRAIPRARSTSPREKRPRR